MTLPDRKYSSGKGYRFGFNGMETDDEVKGEGNSYTTPFRQYDPRLGRWLSLDPLMAKYPGQSPFAGFKDNPIYYMDPTGLEGDPPGSREHFITSKVDEEKKTRVTMYQHDRYEETHDDGSVTITKVKTKVENIVGNYHQDSEYYYDPIKNSPVEITTFTEHYDVEGNLVGLNTIEEIIERDEYSGDTRLLDDWTNKISDFNKSHKDITWNEKHHNKGGWAMAGVAVVAAAAPFGPQIGTAGAAANNWIIKTAGQWTEILAAVGLPTSVAGVSTLSYIEMHKSSLRREIL